MFNRRISVPLVAAALIVGTAAPATAFGAPPVWLTGNSSGYQDWTVTSISAVGNEVVELENNQSFSGDAFSEESLVAFDIVYSEFGNFAYGIGDSTENYYSIDLDDDTMTVVWEDLGDAGEDNINTFAANGDAGYVTYVNPDSGNIALGSINYGSFAIDNVVDFATPRIPYSLGYFDGEFYVITEEAFIFTLNSLDLSTGVLTPLEEFTGNTDVVYDGDIDNNGNFRSLTEDNDGNVQIYEYNVLTGESSLESVNPVTGSPMAFWGTPDEIVATGGGDDSSGGLASTGFDGTAAFVGTSLLAVAAGVVLTVRRRRTRA